jgi:hypothetical protein
VDIPGVLCGEIHPAKRIDPMARNAKKMFTFSFMYESILHTG